MESFESSDGESEEDSDDGRKLNNFDTGVGSGGSGKSNLYDYRTFKIEKYVRDFPWLYYNVIENGYKCKTCEMFPALSSTGGVSKHKFISIAVKGLTDHPRRVLHIHETSNKHLVAIKQHEGSIFFSLGAPTVRNYSFLV